MVSIAIGSKSASLVATSASAHRRTACTGMTHGAGPVKLRANHLSFDCRAHPRSQEACAAAAGVCIHVTAAVQGRSRCQPARSSRASGENPFGEKRHVSSRDSQRWVDHQAQLHGRTAHAVSSRRSLLDGDVGIESPSTPPLRMPSVSAKAPMSSAQTAMTTCEEVC